jgi:hypothetical protein
MKRRAFTARLAGLAALPAPARGQGSASEVAASFAASANQCSLTSELPTGRAAISQFVKAIWHSR